MLLFKQSMASVAFQIYKRRFHEAFTKVRFFTQCAFFVPRKPGISIFCNNYANLFFQFKENVFIRRGKAELSQSDSSVEVKGKQ